MAMRLTSIRLVVAAHPALPPIGMERDEGRTQRAPHDTMVHVASEPPDGARSPRPRKAGSRRANRLMITGAILVILGVVLALTARTTYGAEDTGADWTGPVIALTGAGTLALGFAHFVRDSMRYRREQRRADTESSDNRGYP
jgi:hypothetical protein